MGSTEPILTREMGVAAAKPTLLDPDKICYVLFRGTRNKKEPFVIPSFPEDGLTFQFFLI